MPRFRPPQVGSPGLIETQLRYPRQDPGFEAQIAGTGLNAIAHMLGTVADVGTHITQIELRERKTKALADASSIYVSSAQQMERAFGEYQETEGHETFLPKYTAKVNEVLKESYGKVRDPDAQKYLHEHLGSYVLRRYDDATKIGVKKKVDYFEGATAAMMDTEKKFAISTGRYADAQDSMDRVDRALDQHTVLFGSEKVAKIKKEFRQNVAASFARQHAHQRPEDFQQNYKLYEQDADPKLLDSLLEQVPKLIEHNERVANQKLDQQERNEARAAKQIQDDLRSQIEGRLYQNWDLNNPNPENMEAEISKSWRSLGQDHTTALRSLNRALGEAWARDARREAREKSDPETLVSIMADIETGRPIKFKDVEQAIKSGGLNVTDGIAALKALRARIEHGEAKGIAAQGRAETARDKLIHEGYAYVDRNLKLAGAMDFDRFSEQITASARLEYTRRVREDPRVDPLSLANQMTGPGSDYANAIKVRGSNPPGHEFAPALRFKTRNEILDAVNTKGPGRISRELAEFYLGELERASETPQAPPVSESERKRKKPKRAY